MGTLRLCQGGSIPAGASTAAPCPQAPALRQGPGGLRVLIPRTCATSAPPRLAARAYLSPPQGSNVGWLSGGLTGLPCVAHSPRRAWPGSAAVGCGEGVKLPGCKFWCHCNREDLGEEDGAEPEQR